MFKDLNQQKHIEVKNQREQLIEQQHYNKRLALSKWDIYRTIREYKLDKISEKNKRQWQMMTWIALVKMDPIVRKIDTNIQVIFAMKKDKAMRNCIARIIQ